jgi:large subunit ribosomal protein L22
MEVRSVYRHAKISARKAREVAREIQGLPVSHALDILTFTPRKAALLLEKTLKSAIANAEHNDELDADTLVIKEATVGEGATLKRFKPRARGSAGPIRKRTSHLTIILTDEQAEAPEKARNLSGEGKAKKSAPQKEKKAEIEEMEEIEKVEMAGEELGEK